MAERAPSPIVSDHSWGTITVDGLGQFRDVKLWPGGGREWNWDETGTRHEPGIQPADVEGLLAADPDVVVLSRGRELRLKTCPSTIALLEANDISIVHDETSAAIARYNELAQGGRRAAALIHSTCWAEGVSAGTR
jgi:hypothetical protein